MARVNKSNKKHFVYIMLHIPKTAGTTFHYHICNNFEESEIIFVYESTRYYNKPPYYFTQKKVKNYLKSIPNEKKDKIKIVLGHDVYMGIHKNFNRPERYITFLRNPVDRTISFYNHMRENFEYNRPMLDRSSILSATGRLLRFHEWFERNVEMHNYMTKFFIKRFNRERMGGKIEHEHLEKAKKCLIIFILLE